MNEENAELQAELQNVTQTSNIEPLRKSIQTSEGKLAGYIATLAEADTTIIDMERKLDGWRRFREYTDRKRQAVRQRILSEREELRAEEDYQSEAY